jgi:hypothetical protein
MTDCALRIATTGSFDQHPSPDRSSSRDHDFSSKSRPHLGVTRGPQSSLIGTCIMTGVRLHLR